MELWQLKQMQGLPLEVKIQKTNQRIIEFYEHFNGMVYVSHSGGKDSTLLYYLVKKIYPDVPGVFVNTGNEYPELVRFMREQSDIVWLKPKIKIKQVFEKYGFPVGSKKKAYDVHKLRHQNLTPKYRNYLLNGDERGKAGCIGKIGKLLVEAPFDTHSICCDIIKKNPLKKYHKETGRVPITGERCAESKTRQDAYLAHGCNAYNANIPKCTPLAFWTDQDVLHYYHLYKTEMCSLYGKIIKGNGGIYELTGLPRLGCVSCMMGVHLQKLPNRFQILELTHPKLHRHCMVYLGIEQVLQYINVPYQCYDKKYYGVKCKGGEQLKMII